MQGRRQGLASVDKSAEYLRLALPLMSKQAAGLHPVSYAVWYEYVSGTNPALRAAIDERLKSGVLLDENHTEFLYRRFIAEIDEEQATRISNGFKRVLSDIDSSASVAGEQAGKFGNSLERWSANLTNHAGVADSLGELLGDTREMQSNVAQLQARTPGWREADVWFCGPAGFGHTLREGLCGEGLPAARFHQELFEMR